MTLPSVDADELAACEEAASAVAAALVADMAALRQTLQATDGPGDWTELLRDGRP